MASPGCFRHWSIDLLEVKLALYHLFVDIWDHVWWLDEWHWKGRSHHDWETSLCFRLLEIKQDWVKLVAYPSFRFKWFDDYRILLILLNLMEVLEVHRHILILFICLPKLLEDHGSYQQKLSHSLREFISLWIHGQYLWNFLKCLAPVFELNENDHLVERVFTHIKGAKSNFGQVSLLAIVIALQWLIWRYQLAHWELAKHLLCFGLNTHFLGSTCVFFVCLVGHKVLFPWLVKIIKGSIIILCINLEYGAIQIHFLKLENVFTVVSETVNVIELFLLSWWEWSILGNAFLMWLQFIDDQFLLYLDLAHIWNDLYSHWWMLLFDGDMLILFINSDDAWYLIGAV